jgi:AraC family transcriptional regulator
LGHRDDRAGPKTAPRHAAPCGPCSGSSARRCRCPLRFNGEVEHLDAAVLLRTSVVEAVHVSCCSPRSKAGDEEWNSLPQIVLPRRGLFAIHRYGETVLADSTTAIIFGRDEGYRASHPVDGGDECLRLQVQPELQEEAVGSLGGCSGRLSPRTQLGAWMFAGLVRSGDADPLAGEEGALLLLDAVASGLARASSPERRVSKTQRDRADEVRALLADDVSRPWRLDVLARTVHCSPFHLCRQFRRATGETMSRYRLRLRLAAALHRIAEGESDLARLATDLGFSHHSHFTARFGAVFGCTPADARAVLSAPRIRDLSKFLTA